MKSFNIVFFASHGGTNMQAIIDNIENGKLISKPSLVISNNSKSGAAERAHNYNIPFYHISSKTHPDENGQINYISSLFDKFNIDLVILAGYMKKFPKELIDKVGGKVLNIHPALLPKFGGENMYGLNVHKAVIDAKERISGATIHLVDSEYDRGRILLQHKVDVFPEDTPEDLAVRVLKIEHKLYPQCISFLEQEKLII
jgi:phosphoribosylglycinamide formyltransferase-1